MGYAGSLLALACVVESQAAQQQTHSAASILLWRISFARAESILSQTGSGATMNVFGLSVFFLSSVQIVRDCAYVVRASRW